MIGMAGGRRRVGQKRADRREQNPEGIPQTPWDGIRSVCDQQARWKLTLVPGLGRDSGSRIIHTVEFPP